ncbi:MAG: hypothetical protein JZU47_02145 [Prolixibacteraceae bacterium]|nr:hypothetical protein [Prolixibacteraceae bacterium]
MKNSLNSGLKIILCLLLFHASQSSYSQSTVLFDEIVSEIYSQNFNDVEPKIEKLKKTSPLFANYLQVDYLWWKMITFYTDSNKSRFLTELDALNSGKKTTEYQDYDRLIYFTYQIRYENLTNKSFSKYMTSLKFHFFIESIDLNKLESTDSFIKNMFALMNELDVFMKYQFLNDHGLKTKNNTEKCHLCLQNIENMYNSEYKSFDIVKTYLLAKIYFEIEGDKQKAFVKFAKLSNMFPKNTIIKQAVADCKKN